MIRKFGGTALLRLASSSFSSLLYFFLLFLLACSPCVRSLDNQLIKQAAAAADRGPLARLEGALAAGQGAMLI